MIEVFHLEEFDKVLEGFQKLFSNENYCDCYDRWFGYIFLGRVTICSARMRNNINLRMDSEG